MNENVIYAQVLLLDGKIESWKICQSKKNHPYDFKAYWKQDRVNDYTMETKTFRKEEIIVPDGWNFNSYVYNVLGVRFINQYEYADDYKLAKAIEKTLGEVEEEMELLNNALGGRFEVVGCLGKN